MRQKEKLTIPLDCIPEGIELCLNKAAQFCMDAKVLANNRSYYHALGLCIYAVEELGRAELLREMVNIAKKHGENCITFEYTKPEVFYRLSTKELKKRGFRIKQDINPFYDHPSKLLYGRSMLYDSTNNRIWKLLDTTNIRSFDELVQAYEKLPSPTYCAIPLDTATRERIMYVGFNQKNSKWNYGLPKISLKDILELSEDLENEIATVRNTVD